MLAKSSTDGGLMESDNDESSGSSRSPITVTLRSHAMKLEEGEAECVCKREGGGRVQRRSEK